MWPPRGACPLPRRPVSCKLWVMTGCRSHTNSTKVEAGKPCWSLDRVGAVDLVGSGPWVITAGTWRGCPYRGPWWHSKGGSDPCRWARVFLTSCVKGGTSAHLGVRVCLEEKGLVRPSCEFSFFPLCWREGLADTGYPDMSVWPALPQTNRWKQLTVFVASVKT